MIKRLVLQERNVRHAIEVVEVGCGPARILPLLAGIEGIVLTGLDHDPLFVEYAKQQVSNMGIEVVLGDIEYYKHKKPVDVFVSQGVHHHIPKGEITRRYLQNLSGQLVDGGAYIVGDEFLPEYSSENERKVKAVVWYSHIIAEAQKGGFVQLAREEAKTLLDDLYEGDADRHLKDDSQIELVLDSVNSINEIALIGRIKEAERKAQKLLEQVYGSRQLYAGNDPTMILSRGDFKICESEFRLEIAAAGFVIEKKVVVGPNVDIGAMVVYLLRKN